VNAEERVERLSFAERVHQIDARVREIDSGIENLRLELDGETATWQCGDYNATLVLHGSEEPVRLSLSLHTGSMHHPDSEQIGIDDPDSVELLAQPIARLLSGEVTE
jgi:hypothetical protein